MMVTCPGRTRTDTNNRQGKPGTYVDGDPVNIRLSLLFLGDIVLQVLMQKFIILLLSDYKKSLPRPLQYLQPLQTEHQIKDISPVMMLL